MVQWAWGLCDPELQYNKKSWAQWSNEDLDSLNLHELSHKYGSEDNSSKGEFMNAHLLGGLMSQDLASNTFYKYMKFQAEKQAKKQCK